MNRMLKRHAVWPLLLITLSALAEISVMERKAARVADEASAAAVKRIQLACGTTNLKIEIDWSGYDHLDYKTADTTRDRAVDYVSSRLREVALNAEEACKDMRYKVEMAEITSIRLVVNSNLKERNFQYRHDDNKLEVTYPAIFSAAPAYNIKALKESF